MNQMHQDMQPSIPPRSDSTSSSSSNDSSDSGKELAYNNGADSTDSGASFTFRQMSTSRSNTPQCRRATFKDMENVSREVPLAAFASNMVDTDICSVSKKRVSTPNSIDISVEMSNKEKNKITRKNLTIIYSIIYGMLLTVMGGIIYINHQSPDTRHVSEIFSTCVSLMGMLWLGFFHIDLHRYKKKALKRMMGTPDQIDRISTCTDFNYAITFIGNEIPPYRFLTGRHSGSFYLKAGMAAFCFGHLINEGLQLGQQILDFTSENRYLLGCGEISTLIARIVRPLYSFYQLFIVFKYSNIVINRHKMLACFALMHIMATCLCFWFGTIVEDALEDYHHKLSRKSNLTKNETLNSVLDHPMCAELTESQCKCAINAVLSVNNVQAIPYLYPFTIEFNLLLAGVWFIVWHNIGKEHHRANPHHFHHKIHNNDGIEEVTFHSNLIISADCHASNKGLFAGLFILLSAIISIIVFFVAMSTKEYQQIGLSIHYFQEGILTVVTLICVLIAQRQLSKLDFNKHPIHFLDDVLLIVPLPFYFAQAIMTIFSEYQKKSTIRIVMSILIPIQVILQTPFIIDGLRRCSNSQTLRYKKPGREVVTFLIVCNLATWIINTFEAKSVQSHYGLNAFFGEFVWMFVTHTCLPLMLFYRFHSSVCLADIWKSAYEKGE
ncbi:Proton channel OtopLc [Araneus ventricosus]|uniref:Proton channel OtopLc n=1 Tax=Araneus ventricosus TaxID=182803 RepID=A0A4Y2CXN9_ARAVE|nr:Proton channel OtopLc [Araneus ventricosus]